MVEEKKCPSCGQTDLDKFNKKGKKRLQSFCQDCSREKSRLHYNANKKRYRDLSNKRRAVVQKYIVTLKETTPCLDCRNYFPACVMEFDHQRDKKFEIATAPSRGVNLETVKNEIEKCHLVCANCHRIRTHIKS